MAVLTVLVASLWGTFELVRRRRNRLRFVAFSLLAAGMATSILIFVSLPYFERPEATGDADLVVSRWKTEHLVSEQMDQSLTRGPRSPQEDEAVSFTTAAFWSRAFQIQTIVQAKAFPTLRTALALFAAVVLVWGAGPLSRGVRGGLLLFLAGAFCSLPETAVLSMQTPFCIDRGTAPDGHPARDPGPFRSRRPPICSHLRYGPGCFDSGGARGPAQATDAGPVFCRFVTGGGLRGGSQVGTPTRFIAFLLSEERVTNLQETGRWRLARFFEPTLEENRTLTTDRATYERIAEILKEEGGGPLIELPAKADRPETLVGQRILEEPNIFFYSGYEPPHSLLIRRLTSILPEPFALQDLIMLTDLRWILVRRDTEKRPGARHGIAKESWNSATGRNFLAIQCFHPDEAPRPLSKSRMGKGALSSRGARSNDSRVKTGCPRAQQNCIRKSSSPPSPMPFPTLPAWGRIS